MNLLLVGLLTLQPQATTSQQDAEALLTEVLEYQPTQHALQREFSYRETATEHDLSGDGAIRKTKEEVFSVSPSPDGEYRRLIAKNGRTLDAKQTAKEDDKFRKYLEKQSKLKPKEREKQAEKLANQVKRLQNRLRQAIEVLEFTELPGEVIGEVPVRVFSFAPKPDYEPHSRATQVLTRLEGSIAIDAERRQIARLELHLRENLNFLAGIFGRVSKGTVAKARARRENDVWLMDRIDVDLRARFYFLKRYRRRMAYVYSDYQRFSVETDEQYGKRPPTGGSEQVRASSTPRTHSP